MESHIEARWVRVTTLFFFDIEVAAMKNCTLVQINSMNLEFSQAANTYCLTDSKVDAPKP
jgi:hypothetical protein